MCDGNLTRQLQAVLHGWPTLQSALGPTFSPTLTCGVFVFRAASAAPPPSPALPSPSTTNHQPSLLTHPLSHQSPSTHFTHHSIPHTVTQYTHSHHSHSHYLHSHHLLPHTLTHSILTTHTHSHHLHTHITYTLTSLTGNSRGRHGTWGSARDVMYALASRLASPGLRGSVL